MIEQGRTDAILAAFETIVSDADLGCDGGYEAAFLAYGLYGIFVTWARGGWTETPREMAALVSRGIFGYKLIYQIGLLPLSSTSGFFGSLAYTTTS